MLAMGADRRRDLALETERGPPPHFAGRRTELAAMLRRLKLVREHGHAKSGIALVTGVPGGGKTQFAERFAAEVEASASGGAKTQRERHRGEGRGGTRSRR